MKKLLILVAMLVVALPMGARAAEEAKAATTTKDGKPYFEASERVTAQATVIRIEAATRKVTLKGEHGDTLRLECGPEVKNFAQIKVGDLVKVSYTEQLTVTVEAAGAPGASTETTTGAAKLGEMPKGSVTEQTQVKAAITAINKAEGTATLKAHDGEEFIITPLHPENLNKVKVGELVVFTYTSSIAVSVERVAPKAAAKKK
jgi:hypothetical protein